MLRGAVFDALTFSWTDGVSAEWTGDALFVASATGNVRVGELSKEVAGALVRLNGRGVSGRELMQVIVACRVDQLAGLYYELSRLASLGLVTLTATGGGRAIAELRPISPGFRLRELSPEPPAWRLSRFAFCRVEGERWVVESPRGHAVVGLLDPGAAAVVGALAQPLDSDALAAVAAVHLSGITRSELRAFVALLELAHAVTPVDARGMTDETADPALRMWSFHDLLFHARTRFGRHNGPSGATLRFAGEIPPPPFRPTRANADWIPLERPDIEALERSDPPFTRVLERRRSLRTYGANPITRRQLGEFLYRSARVQERFEVKVAGGAHGPGESVELSRRPSPSGGAIHELETYLAIHRCEGLEQGLYQYDPVEHRLARIDCNPKLLQALIRDAVRATRLACEPQVLVILASRFGRANWKYESIAYALTLKNAGALIQTMYLVATAMGLAPTAVGLGDADLFARAAGTNYYEETSVAEFLLGSRADATALSERPLPT